jgi:type I restriction enzyme, S subunit
MKKNAEYPSDWTLKALRDVAEIRSGTIKPTNYPNEIFDLYSIPAFDDIKKPRKDSGKDIKSNKTIVKSGDCLFSKLNPRICRVWLVDEPQDNRQIATTEFWPIYSKLRKGAPWFIPQYLAYILSFKEFRSGFVNQVEASTRSRERLKPELLLDQTIPLPPLPVQERI